MPVIVVLDRLPESEGLRAMHRVGRGVQHHMKSVGNGADAKQGTAKQSGEVPHRSGFHGAAFEVGFVIARRDPCLVRNTRGVRTARDVSATQFDHPRFLLLLLMEYVAEDAALLHAVMFASGTQFVQHAPGYEGSRDNLRCRMVKLLPGEAAEI